MDIIFWKGLFLGMLIALPSGPVSFLIIRRIYFFGIRSGMFSVIGSIITDIFYIVVVGFGLKTIERFLGTISGYTEIIAGLIIMASGYHMIRERRKILNQEIHHQHPVKSLFSTTFLNLLNPTIVFSFGVLFLTFGLKDSIGNPRDIATVIVGFVTGGLLFWYLLGRLIIHIRTTNHGEKIETINRGFGFVLLGIGIVMLFLAVIHIIFPGFHSGL
jgi:threonine/homoserine/homoserine lactone efflux protein